MTIKIGVLGCTRVAEKNFFPNITSYKIAELDFIASRSNSKAEERSKKYKWILWWYFKYKLWKVSFRFREYNKNNFRLL